VIGPLQVVQEYSQGMVDSGEDPHELCKDVFEAVARLARRKFLNHRLRPDDEPHFGNHVDDKTAVGSEYREQFLLPGGETGVAFGEQVSYQFAEGLDEGVEGDVAFELIKLAGDKIPFLMNDRLLNLAYQRGLADPRIARYQQKFRSATAGALESLK